MSGTEEPVEKRPSPPPPGPGGLGGLHGVDFRKLGYHNPRLERDVIHAGEEDPKADLHHGYPDDAHRHHKGYIAGEPAEKDLLKRLPRVHTPRPTDDPDAEFYDPIVQGFVNEHPGVQTAPYIVPKDMPDADADGRTRRRGPLAQRIERSLEHSPTMRNQLVDIPDPDLVEDPAEGREDHIDYQIAAPMDEVDPYADNRQFKTSI